MQKSHYENIKSSKASGGTAAGFNGAQSIILFQGVKLSSGGLTTFLKSVVCIEYFLLFFFGFAYVAWHSGLF